MTELVFILDLSGCMSGQKKNPAFEKHGTAPTGAKQEVVQPVDILESHQTGGTRRAGQCLSCHETDSAKSGIA